MTIEVKTGIGLNGTFKTEDIHAVEQLVNADTPVVNIGDKVALTKDDIVSFYTGAPAEGEGTNLFNVVTRNGEEYVISMPEGEGAAQITEQINTHAQGEPDRFGNRIVRRPFIVLGDTYAVGIRHTDFRFAKAVDLNN